jgi:hypothetical protein
MTIGLRVEGARISENWLVNWKTGINLCVSYKRKLVNRLLMYQGITVFVFIILQQTKHIEKNPWQADSRLASQGISRLLWTRLFITASTGVRILNAIHTSSQSPSICVSITGMTKVKATRAPVSVLRRLGNALTSAIKRILPNLYSALS